MEIKIYCDGGSRGNPGPAAIGAVAFKDGKKLFEISQKIGEATNNQAEYRAVIAALEKMITISSGQYAVTLFLDSELLVRQLNQEYKIKEPQLKELFWQVRDLVLKLGGRVSFVYLPRQQNRLADCLVNEALNH